jgi:hypothetical protein
LAAVVVGALCLTWWALRERRLNLLSLPIFPMAYAEIDAAAVPASIHAAFATIYAELTPLGFEPAGYIASPIFPGAPPRILGVLRHPTRAVASAAFALGAHRGSVVDFETLFEDGSWLRTVNRRGHYSRASYRSGREVDAMAATLAEQWAAHQRALAEGTPHAAREVDAAALARHRNEVELEEHELGLEDGSRRRADEGVSLRFTQAGADAFVARVQAGARRMAALPPVRGALAMRIPADEQERKYQDILYLMAQRPKPRRRWAFLASAALFAASSVLLPHWRWLLWAIPFLLLHELGHFGAMRLFGHSDAHIRFIPFFGAATMTMTRFRKLSHEMVVLFAGPLPGLLLGLALFQIAEPGRSSYILGSAIMLVTLNGLNLLPLHPLDGGRIVHALLTAGRPRLDFALKVLAGAVIVGCALKFHDYLILVVAGVAMMFFRTGVAQSRVENVVRRRPEFSPALTPEARRRLVFETMDAQGGDGRTWVQLVRQLEARLAHQPPRLAAALPWTALYVGSLTALIAWSVSVFAIRPKLGAHCPKRARATPVACGAGAAGVDWRHPDPGSLTRSPFKLFSRGPYPYAAFVWCAGPEASAVVQNELTPLASADGLCPALPWESAAETEVREKARWTLMVVAPAGYPMTRERGLERVAYVEERLGRQSKFDAETLRLYRAMLDEPAEGDAHRRLSERIGRSPTESCQRLRVLRTGLEVERPLDQTSDDGARDDEDDEPDEADGSRPNGVRSARLSVLLASPDDLEPLRRHLCALGCEVSVLPYGSMDPRLRRCY